MNPQELRKYVPKFRRLIFFFLIMFLPISGISQAIYRTPSGAKYHLENCRTVRNVSHKVTVDQARELGLTACKVCNPIDINTVNPLKSSKAKGQGISVQCKGQTQARTRCKRMTRIGNGYCFQHGPNKN